MIILRLLTLFLALALGATAAHADLSRELRQAQKALAAGDYEKAFNEYGRVARENNNPLAQFSLALFFEYGWGRPADRVEACRWYEKAAAGDIPAAAHFLGDCLVQGVHRAADAKQAAHWYLQAADLGHYASLCSLAELYMQGNGVSADPARGLALCEQAAQQGVVSAMTRLGRFYLEGHESIRDYVAARRWFEAGAQRGSAQSQYLLALILRDGLGHEKDPLGARGWFEAAASQGYVAAYYPVAELYFNAPPDPDTGLWSEQDLAKTYLWLSAALQRSEDADARARLEGMLARVREVMPETWVPDLNAKVTDHLATYAAERR